MSKLMNKGGKQKEAMDAFTVAKKHFQESLRDDDQIAAGLFALAVAIELKLDAMDDRLARLERA